MEIGKNKSSAKWQSVSNVRQWEHCGETYAHASTFSFPVCTCWVVQINFVVRIAVCKLVVVNQQPQMKEKGTTNTKEVCRQ